MLDIRFFLSKSIILRPLLKLYYKLALSLVKFYAAKHPKVKSLLLLGSGAREEFCYGVSDIDLVIIVDDEKELAELKQIVLFDLSVIRIFFPMLSIGPHEIIFSESERLHCLVRRFPFYFSVDRMIKVLYARENDDYRIPYSLEHELSCLSFLWDKFRILLSYKKEIAYFCYLYTRISEALDLLDERLEHGFNGNKNSSYSVASLFLRFVSSYSHAFSRIYGYQAGQEGVGTARENSTEITIPNYLYFETAGLESLFSLDAVKRELTCRLADDGSVSTLSDAVFERDYFGRADILYVGGLCFPLHAADALDLGILNPEDNPLTFAALTGKVEQSEDREAWCWKEYLQGFRQKTRLLPDVVKSNTSFFERLNRDVNLLFRINSMEIAFVSCVLVVWWKICRDRFSAEELSVRFTKAEMESLQPIFSCIYRQEFSEALLMLKNYFQNIEQTPRQLKVSVLIPTRNREALLGKALESVFRQRLQAFEVIVVDNDSSDQTHHTVRRYQESYPQLKYFRETVPGIPHARNRALLESSVKADIVVFMDDDCQADSDWLYEMSLPFRYDDNIVSVGGAIEFSSSDRSLWGDFYYLREGKHRDYSIRS